MCKLKFEISPIAADGSSLLCADVDDCLRSLDEIVFDKVQRMERNLVNWQLVASSVSQLRTWVMTRRLPCERIERMGITITSVGADHANA